MIDEPSEWHMAIGAAMPTVPYSKSELMGLPFESSWDFYYTQMTMGGYTDEQIKAYTEYLLSPAASEPEDPIAAWSKIKPEDFQMFDSSKRGDNGQG